MTNKKEIKTFTKEPAYDKKSILASKSFRSDRDLLNAVLEDVKVYTLKEVEELLKNIKNKEVR